MRSSGQPSYALRAANGRITYVRCYRLPCPRQTIWAALPQARFRQPDCSPKRVCGGSGHAPGSLEFDRWRSRSVLRERWRGISAPTGHYAWFGHGFPHSAAAVPQEQALLTGPVAGSVTTYQAHVHTEALSVWNAPAVAYSWCLEGHPRRLCPSSAPSPNLCHRRSYYCLQ